MPKAKSDRHTAKPPRILRSTLNSAKILFQERLHKDPNWNTIYLQLNLLTSLKEATWEAIEEHGTYDEAKTRVDPFITTLINKKTDTYASWSKFKEIITLPNDVQEGHFDDLLGWLDREIRHLGEQYNTYLVSNLLQIAAEL